MPKFSHVLLLIAGLALAACSNPDRFGPGSDGFGPGGPGMGIDQSGLGDVNDPRSPAFFQSRVGDRVFFTVDSSSLNDQARQTLQAQARWLIDNPEYRIIIEGHADERGTREYNVALGARRANAVLEFLNAQGISQGRMRTVSYGKERPVEACAEQRCWDINRRAVTLISTGSGV
jgi:peptidoglycan-associated lipoprotein